MQNSFLFSQLLYQSPMLLVYIGGIVLAAVWSRRARSAALLALIGLAIMLTSTLGHAVILNYLFSRPGGPSAFASGTLFTIVGIASSILHAVGMAMVVAGVFVARPRPEPRVSGFDVQPGPPMVPPPIP